jgi:hypothetical protein
MREKRTEYFGLKRKREVVVKERESRIRRDKRNAEILWRCAIRGR